MNPPEDRTETAFDDALRKAFEAGYNAGWVAHMTEGDQSVTEAWRAVSPAILAEARAKMKRGADQELGGGG